ncbi:hypothetical protein LENED_001493 [Lentinula edodes]|uniref:Uncharacterized protein n=1 Tax=Lentinula edodes TaxID=5353 RepID=A0A1Q3DYS0_LENED|nr:hypothetical protein LENED_001493 [Lentinula edodes]
MSFAGMSAEQLGNLRNNLLEGFYYLGNQRSLPEGCRWTTLDGKQFVTVPATQQNSIPTIAPFTLVGRVATNLNNTGILGSWSRNSRFPPETSRRTFQIGPALGHVFQQDWAPAMAKLKELQLIASSNSRKVQYLFVHENVPPQDCILRAGARVFRDLEDGEENNSVQEAVPKGKEDDPAWIDIVDSKNFAEFPLYDIDGERIPLKKVRTAMAGAIVLLTFSLHCWHFVPTDPFSFAADVERVDILLPAHKTPITMTLPPTPPKTPKQKGKVATPAHRLQALYTMQPDNVATSETNFCAPLTSPQSPYPTPESSVNNHTTYGTPTGTFHSSTPTAGYMSASDAQSPYDLFTPTASPSGNQLLNSVEKQHTEYPLQLPGSDNQPMDTWYNSVYVRNGPNVLNPTLGPPFAHVTLAAGDANITRGIEFHYAIVTTKRLTFYATGAPSAVPYVHTEINGRDGGDGGKTQASVCLTLDHHDIETDKSTGTNTKDKATNNMVSEDPGKAVAVTHLKRKRVADNEHQSERDAKRIDVEIRSDA